MAPHDRSRRYRLPGVWQNPAGDEDRYRPLLLYGVRGRILSRRRAPRRPLTGGTMRVVGCRVPAPGPILELGQLRPWANTSRPVAVRGRSGPAKGSIRRRGHLTLPVECQWFRWIPAHMPSGASSPSHVTPDATGAARIGRVTHRPTGLGRPVDGPTKANPPGPVALATTKALCSVRRRATHGYPDAG